MAKDQRYVCGNRRFTCLSPHLVRLEFAPDGVFEDRRSLVAYAPKKPKHFHAVKDDGDWTVLKTGFLEIRSRRNDSAFSEHSLEIRWLPGRLLQYWRPGDRDHRNLGGTARSLDRYGASAVIDGVHTADMSPPDAKGLEWLAWLQCEQDPAYYKASPVPQKTDNSGDWHGFAARRDHEGRLLERTLNYVIDSHKYSVGVLSESGYFFLNDSFSPLVDGDDFPVERNCPGYQDWYFFAYGDNYRQALEDYVLLTGRANLPTRNSFGLLFSRWPAYDETEAKEIIARFDRHGYPLSTIVLDMEWHKEGWGNWDWNEALYADPKAFFAWCRDRGIEVTLNDHPLDVRSDDSHFEKYLLEAGSGDRVRDIKYHKKTLPAVDVNICDKKEAQAFSRVCHQHIVDAGLAYWWNDGCRGELAGAFNQLVANKFFFEEVESRKQRGMLLARYGGMGSHRYGLYFTGDTKSCWEILRLQCEFNIRAGHVGVSNVSHDIGGFFTGRKVDLIEPDLYLRWLQFGVFGPILRFHSAPGGGSRQPWDYDGRLRGAAKRWLQVRNSLLPYIYTAAREHHDTGVPIVRGLFLDEPQERASYRFDQYLFGPSMLVAPVLGPERARDVYLPNGDWYNFESNRRVRGGVVHKLRVPLKTIPVFVRAGSIIPRQSSDGPLHQPHIDPLILDVYPGADGDAELYEDDGKTPGYKRGRCCRTRLRLHHRPEELRLVIEKPDGKSFGKTRRISLVLAVDKAPQEVLVNRRKVKAAKEVLPDGRVRLDLGELRTGVRQDIRIR